MTNPIEVRKIDDSSVTQIVLQRAADGNALNIALAQAFEGAVDEAIADGTRVLLVTAEGKLFCAGGDVRAMSTADAPGAYTHELASAMHRAMLRIAESDLLFVCGVQGAAAGAGFSMVLNADYVIASERASFMTAYLSLGVTPDLGASYLLPRVVGRIRASELALTARKLDAQTAMDWGVVNEVVAPAALEELAVERAATLAATPARGAAGTKRLLAENWLDGFRAHLDREAASIAELIESPESRERQARFLGGK